MRLLSGVQIRFWCCTLLVILASAVIAYYIMADRYFESHADIQPRYVVEDWGANVKIGIIGDSWVAGQKIDQAVQDALAASGISATVISSGHPGAKSRQIYQDMIAKEVTPFSSNHILMDEDLDYLVVVAGVNDTAGHIGSDFYAHHMLCIIKAIQARGIYPIIVEVPEYGIEDTTEIGILSYMKRSVYQIFFDGMQQDVIDRYRQSLRQRLASEKIENVFIISFSSVVDDYSKHIGLYANPSHLNDEGYQKLGHAIGANVAALHKSRQQKVDKKILFDVTEQ